MTSVPTAAMHQQAFLRREVTTKGEQKLEVPGGRPCRSRVHHVVKAQLQPLMLPNAPNAHGTNQIRIENGKHMIEPVAQDALIVGEDLAVTHTAQPTLGELREVDVLKSIGDHAAEALRSSAGDRLRSIAGGAFARNTRGNRWVT